MKLHKDIIPGTICKLGEEILIPGLITAYNRPPSGDQYFARDINGIARYLPATEFKKLIPIDVSKDPTLLAKTVYKHAAGTSGETGADPEIFAFRANGTVLPAWEFLPAPDASNLYWDGVQAEFKVQEGSCHEGLTDRVRTLLLLLNQTLKKHDPKAYLQPQDVVKLDKKILLTAADEHVKLGCAASHNAYNIPAIDIGDYRQHRYRYSGCHFHHSASGIYANHLQYNKIIDWFPQGTVVMIDKIAGLCLTALGRDLENPLRRKAYGRPGEFRIPGNSDYYFEYRTPGAFCLTSNVIYNFAADICRFGYKMGLYTDGRTFDLPDVKDIILNCDADGAVKVLTKYKDFFMQVFQTIYPAYQPGGGGKKLDYPAATFDMLTKGLTSSGLHKRTMIDNWQLNQAYAQWNNGHTASWKNFVCS